ncbi:Orf y [Tanacetum coccineum]
MLLIQLQSVQERLRLFNNPTTAIEVPEEETLKTTTSPVQTATGKDLTNPLRANALLKSINKDNTSLSSSLSLNSKLVYPNPSTFGKSKMTNLATNPLMQEPVFKPDYLKAAKQEEERYYVVFKGPRAGIYTTWGETQKICQEDKSTNKKFRILEQAQMELRLYGEAKKTTPLLKPKVNPLLAKRREEARDQRISKEKPIGLEPIVHFQEFVQLWNKARAACQQDFINERFYTTDKPTKSLYNFVERSDPQLIYQAFRLGPKILKDNYHCNYYLLKCISLMQPSTSTKKADGRGEKTKASKDRLAFILSNTVVRYGQIKNHKKTVKIEQTRTRESEELKKKPKIQSRSPKSQASVKFSQRWCPQLDQTATNKAQMIEEMIGQD